MLSPSGGLIVLCFILDGGGNSFYHLHLMCECVYMLRSVYGLFVCGLPEFIAASLMYQRSAVRFILISIYDFGQLNAV